MNAAAIVIRSVTKRFAPRAAAAVDDVSLEIPGGESAVILGPSGCGKTTLLRLLAGLEIPDAGEVSLNGTHASTAGRLIVPPYARRIGFVFQDLALWPHLTVQRNLEFVLDSSHTRRQERKRRVAEILELVRIPELAHRYPLQLSGGEQQRVALARALVGGPHILLLDEPFSSLDAELRATLRSELTALQRRLRPTTVYVTHDLTDAAVLADRIVHMRAGRVTAIDETGNRKEPA